MEHLWYYDPFSIFIASTRPKWLSKSGQVAVAIAIAIAIAIAADVDVIDRWNLLLLLQVAIAVSITVSKQELIYGLVSCVWIIQNK